ncbi:MAG TPA: hypothetical protein VFT70_12110 [Nocardioides sp.]|nr:hypothetical protein [Nocardioides sp.]
MIDHDRPTSDPNSSADLAAVAALGSAPTIVNDDATALALVGYPVGPLWIAPAGPRPDDGRLLFHVEHVGTGPVEHLLSRQVLVIHDRSELNGELRGSSRWPVKAHIACSEPFNVTREELAAATGIDATEVASTLDTLVSRGYVERVGEDCYRLVMPE